MTNPAIKTVHLIDDRRMGGVIRFLDRVAEMRPHDTTAFVKRGTMKGHAHDAGTIVSHLAISWRTLPMMITLRACNPRARIVHVEHSYCAGFQDHRVPLRKRHRFHTLLRIVYALFDDVIAVSEGQARWMRDIGVVPGNKVRVAPPLVDLTPFLAIPDVQQRAGLRYGFVGRLDAQKGLDLILQAWCASAPDDARFEIFGDGPMREDLETLAAGDPRVTFHGATAFPAETYLTFDLALMPSRWEPFGLSCLEARAAGRPVLVAPVDGLPEQIAQGGGQVVTGGPEAWATVFATGIDPAEMARHAGAARAIAVEQARQSRTRWADILEAPASGAAASSGEAVGAK